MNKQLEARLEGIRDVLMAHHRATRLLPSSAKGTEREVLVREFLEKAFPAPYRFGCGAVIDSDGRISGQLDVIVEWPFFPSFPAPTGTNRLYLAESTAFVIEVKSDLRSQWKQVERSALKLRPLLRAWQAHIVWDAADTNIEIFGPSKPRIAFIAVGFTGYETAEKLRKKLDSTPEEARPDAALVVESGAYRSWRLSAEREQGLFAFCIDCSHLAREILYAQPDLATYVTASLRHVPEPSPLSKR